ncbi:hypothetical protein [Nocardioides zeae]|uniref:Ig-like domain repeat protein n=1 Tax=Nocardioides zeae TaxID=1457234 RepID=A0AAJ1UAB2_9ACTN|nr:hypothetical protein [Nocardioides zeae]MDQ1106422.1 hypothetical protein [Nocardioides zeae]
MTRTGSPWAARRGWIVGVALAAVATLAPTVPVPAAAGQAPDPVVEVLAVDEIGYGAGIDVRLRLRDLDPDPYAHLGPGSIFRIALAPPGIEDLAARPDAVASWGPRFSPPTADVPLTFRLPAYTLEPGTTYSLYVVPDGGNAYVQVERPISIDWEALVPHVAITAGAPVTGTYPDVPLRFDLRDVPVRSVVTVTGLPGGPFRTYTNGDSVTPYTRGNDHVGTYTYTATLDVPDGAIGDGLTASGKVTIVRAETVIGTSFLQVPRTNATGRLRTVVAYSLGAKRSPPAPITWKIYQGNRGVWWSGARQVPPSLGDMVVTLPKLPRGSYRVVVEYGGTRNLLPSTATRTFTVR